MRIDDKDYTKNFEWKTWLRLGRFMKPYKWAFVAVFTLNIVAALIDICLPLFQRYAINTFVVGQTTDGLGVFAQQLFGFGRPGDVFLGISTSGNSKNVINATVVARAMGIKVVGLTGAKGGELAAVSDVCVKAPETETYMIQEYHLPIYHCWCLMLEDRFWGGNE